LFFIGTSLIKKFSPYQISISLLLPTERNNIPPIKRAEEDQTRHKLNPSRCNIAQPDTKDMPTKAIYILQAQPTQYKHLIYNHQSYVEVLCPNNPQNQRVEIAITINNEDNAHVDKVFR